MLKYHTFVKVDYHYFKKKVIMSLCTVYMYVYKRNTDRRDIFIALSVAAISLGLL